MPHNCDDRSNKNADAAVDAAVDADSGGRDYSRDSHVVEEDSRSHSAAMFLLLLVTVAGRTCLACSTCSTNHSKNHHRLPPL